MSQVELTYEEKALYYPYCTDDFTNGIYRKPFDIAYEHRYVQINHENEQRYLIFDLDFKVDDWYAFFKSKALIPTWFTINPASGHCHAVFELVTPIHLNEDSSQHAIAYGAAVEYGIRDKLGADRGYTGLMTQNPNHPDWQFEFTGTHYQLGDLAKVVNTTSHKNVEVVDTFGLGRNCTLFDSLRMWGYKNVTEYRDKASYREWLIELQSICYGINDGFSAPLSAKEMKHIINSVGHWCWTRYTGAGGFINRGRDILLGVGRTTQEKQVIAAFETHKQCKAKMTKLITNAVNELRNNLQKVTIRSVAKLLSISPTTVLAYKMLLQ